MDIGQHRTADLFANIPQNRQPRVQADAACGRRRGAVGFIETAFKNQRDAKPVTDFGNLASDRQGMVAAFDLAGPGD